jgi:integrase
MDYARKHSRDGHRDATMVLVTYRHGLRASEVCDLQWHQVELEKISPSALAFGCSHALVAEGFNNKRWAV